MNVTFLEKSAGPEEKITSDVNADYRSLSGPKAIPYGVNMKTHFWKINFLNFF